MKKLAKKKRGIKRLDRLKQLTVLLVFWLGSNIVCAQDTKSKSYKEEEVAFKNGEITLTGTLTLPKTKGKHPAIVLITGSGAQNRDVDIYGFKLFKVIAETLTRQGIAVLRYDDRGVGKSTGKISNSTSADFADDAIAGVKLLEKRNDINPEQIGLLGHSEGGMVAPLAHMKYPKIAFLVLVAGTTVPGYAVNWRQTEAILAAMGKSKEDIEKQKKRSMMLYKTLKTDKGWDKLIKESIEQTVKEIGKLPEAQRAYITDPRAYAKSMVERQIKGIKTTWYRFFMLHDPKESLEKMDCPTLALFGEKDLQVLPDQNIPVLEKALKTAKNKDHTIKTLKGANHLFQKANTGLPTEYAQLPKEFVADFLPVISQWLVKRLRIIK